MLLQVVRIQCSNINDICCSFLQYSAQGRLLISLLWYGIWIPGDEIITVGPLSWSVVADRVNKEVSSLVCISTLRGAVLLTTAPAATHRQRTKLFISREREEGRERNSTQENNKFRLTLQESGVRLTFRTSVNKGHRTPLRRVNNTGNSCRLLKLRLRLHLVCAACLGKRGFMFRPFR